MNSELKCNCQYCNGHIAFPAEMAGQSINCPHCKLETLLFIPPAAVPPKLPEITRSNTSTLRLWFGAIALGIVVLVVALVGGNPPKQRPASPTNLKPVVGAFGWHLRDKLPEQFRAEVKHSTYSFVPEKETPPFDSFELGLTEDGTIYCVNARGFANDYLQFSDLKESLISVLSEKFGLRFHGRDALLKDMEVYEFGLDTQSARLEIQHNIDSALYAFDLKYYDKALQTVYYDEQEAKRQKEQADRKAALSKDL
jgi:hypothetical protein